MDFFTLLAGRPRPVIVVAAFILVLTLGTLDFATGFEFSFSIFYLIPISMVAWYVSRSAGVTLSILSAITWLIADLLSGHVYSHPAIPFWNATVRFGFFTVVTLTLTALHDAERRHDELTEFVVHDLRSPLANVQMGLQSMLELGGETIDATQRQLIDLCLASSARMLLLINSLLDMARLDAGRAQLKPTILQPTALIRSATDQVSLVATQRRVTLATEIDTQVTGILADPDLTDRILVNLLSNAIKFTRRDSTVTLRLAPESRGFVTLSVSDQGPGIPKEWVGKVFDKFAQVEGRRSGAAFGTGLGLTFCRRAVLAQGGRIWVESEADVGTTISFTLPVSG